MASRPFRMHRLTVREEVEGALRWLVARHDEGHRWRDLALVVPGKRKWHGPVVATLDALRIPHRSLIGHPGARRERFDDLDDRLVALSMYAADGLDVACVAIVGLGDLPWKQQTLEEALRVVDVATRNARSSALLTSSKRSALVDALDASGANDAANATSCA